MFRGVEGSAGSCGTSCTIKTVAIAVGPAKAFRLAKAAPEVAELGAKLRDALEAIHVSEGAPITVRALYGVFSASNELVTNLAAQSLVRSLQKPLVDSYLKVWVESPQARAVARAIFSPPRRAWPKG